MTHLEHELDRLQSLIRAESPETRYQHEPTLRHTIEQLRDEGEAVPAQIKELHATLLSEAIEAEFNNMPV